MTRSSPARDRHRTWRTPIGVAGNVAVGLLLIAVTVANATAGKWGYVALAILILVAFGILPAYAAWKAGALLRRGTAPNRVMRGGA
ncbi:MAG TPA: hypothetical protein VFB78_18885 [Acidimicrobiales bacterium]|jgi:hypothetical protein|nr:hypothetical protein [Acidimicrobiales bacterium]